MLAGSLNDTAGHEHCCCAGIPHHGRRAGFGDLRVELISGGRSNLTFKAYDDVTTWVIRRPPTSGLTPSAHDMAPEYTVTYALQDTSVPVPKTISFDADGSALGAPLTVVEFVPARSFAIRPTYRT